MKMYRQEPTLKEWEQMMEAHSKKVTVSKEAAIADLQAAGILDENGDLAEHLRSKDDLYEQDESAQEVCQQLGQQIAQAREERQLTQAELAARAEIPAYMVAQAENGNISVSTLAKIALALDKELSIRLI